ncbi:acetate/propionate family kinase [Legionella hackeliae]|uniref:Acetate kinase n=1 Tax=Legionella hackeliae TaxID=449 RepID=A0A0A8UPJ8_LEGHA|nr:acetate/propionate family kinase [Legionella hackeliae]KTD13939.1 Acetate kinase (Acetokinase) [Legionella hackeliae]CEK10643.1 Acetate kinase [Legionella hackeliae]STX47385.1 Acetate kinase (Acetokinase) [Legionella hackeliae]
MNVLTINAGSSSIKYKALKVNNQQILPLVSGLIEGIGEVTGQWHHTNNKGIKDSQSSTFPNHEEAFSALAAKLKIDLEKYPIQGVGHRVVHGGDEYFLPTIVTPEVLEKIRQLSQLAPIHNPVNALGIQFAQQHFRHALHIAVFDSGFHHSLPPHIHQYAINTEVAEKYKIKRYGFHGINHEYVARTAAAYLGKPLEKCNFISLHLGNGASACLIKQGQSFDTTMGMTPLAGLIMGTRCGDIDPAIPLYLQYQGMSTEQVDTLLNKQSGLKGVANENDMRRLIERALTGDKAANLAIEMYVYSLQKIIGAYNSQIARLDALIFTGGVGENATLIREKILLPLKHLGFDINLAANKERSETNCLDISNAGKPILVIRGDEEALIAQKVESIVINLL